uniref:Uncharacterized protein n=1 Tax=Siphoviridae sp. cttG313 TaxID=2825704 RepID=A0A8S5TS62_9CAUD|nr:MAG TPA: hypothetical protein [Siphoviridae sp. cttG313]
MYIQNQSYTVRYVLTRVNELQSCYSLAITRYSRFLSGNIYNSSFQYTLSKLILLYFMNNFED